MKSRIVVEIDHHPAVETVEQLVRWLDTIIPDLYAVRNYRISQEVVES